MSNDPGVDLSGLHRELDTLKARLCRCEHQGTCIACRGFEVLREQSQMVVAAASQPVLMQVAQEASVKDLMSQMGGLQEKLSGDPHLQEMMARMVERIQDDLGGAEEMEKMIHGLFGPGGFPGGSGSRAPEDVPPEDRVPTDPRPPES